MAGAGVFSLPFAAVPVLVLVLLVRAFVVVVLLVRTLVAGLVFLNTIFLLNL